MGLSSLGKWAKDLEQHTLVAYFAARDPRTPWFARGLALLVAAYALSPVDLIPDFIPVFGYLDDLVIVPLGLALVLRLIPEEIKHSARQQAQVLVARPTGRGMAVAVVAVWLLVAGALGFWAWQWVRLRGAQLDTAP